MNYQYQPLIIIGAARSGTKLLRDIIATHPQVDKVPYDINYIWRMGNEQLSHDELSPEHLTPEIRQKILRLIQKYSSGLPFLVEKTVSNSLRVPYVLEVFPDARFIHIVRDGRDVVESVYRQWFAPTDWKYVWQKALSFPLTDAFSYAVSYARGILYKLMKHDTKQCEVWGVHYLGINEDLLSKDLLEICAIQWSHSVKKALHDLNNLSKEQVLTIRYEDFVCSPVRHLEIIAQFTGLTPNFFLKTINSNFILQSNIGKSYRNLSNEQMCLIMPYIENILSMLSYI